MDNKKLIILTSLIIAGVVLLGIGYLGGALVEKQKVSPQLEQLEKTAKIAKVINSKAVVFITAFGEVTKISDRTITLTSKGESLDIRIREDAEIFPFVPVVPVGERAPTYVPEERKADFSEIKIGSQVNATITILPDGSIEAFSAIVTPSFTPS